MRSLLFVFLALELVVISVSMAGPLNRPADPVVVTGANLSALLGAAPGDIVAFKFSSGWQQIPVQVDERANVDIGAIYHTSSIGVTRLVYTDSNTFTGPDPNTTFDADDELVFMAKDTGNKSTASWDPSGVVANSGVQLTVTDPIDASAVGYVYLFRRSGALDPGAGAHYVTYQFNLLSGAYKTTYNVLTGPNPENSTITTPYYSHHFSDRWVDDELHIYTGGATGVDILDRHKTLFAPGDCTRSENTFSSAEGAFIACKNGPVRAIRSYVGANSGPLTQREHIYYERRQDITTYVRVHDIPGLVDFFDYSPAASGMKYYDDFNTTGVTIDGVADSVAAGAITWELITGAQGSLVVVPTFSTNIAGFAYTSYYLDSRTPPVTQCTGDSYAYGSSGCYINQAIPSTDPMAGSTKYLNMSRSLYYEAPGLTTADAINRKNQSRNQLASAVENWRAVPRTIGIINRDATGPAVTGASGSYFFTAWGRVGAVKSGSFTLDDGSGSPITVNAPGHTLVNGDFAKASGILSVGPPPVLSSSADKVTKMN